MLEPRGEQSKTYSATEESAASLLVRSWDIGIHCKTDKGNSGTWYDSPLSRSYEIEKLGGNSKDQPAFGLRQETREVWWRQ